jgi:hypothetical protein
LAAQCFSLTTIAGAPSGRGPRQLFHCAAFERIAMKEPYQKKVDLGRCGAVTLHVSANGKRLLLEFETEPEGLDKTGLNSFIDALKKVRERMDR